MADKKNLCAQIDIALHNRVTEEKDRLEMTTSQYIASLLTEYYKRPPGDDHQPVHRITAH